MQEKKMQRARALYDNESETSDELSFLRDDLLEVIEKDYDGMEGWWLCGLKGKTGIAPANRLMIITISESPTDRNASEAKYGRTTCIPGRTTEINGRLAPNNLPNSVNQNLKLQNLKSSRNNLFPGDGKEFDDYCVPSQGDKRCSTNGEDPEKISSQASGRDFEKYFASYAKSEKDLNVIAAQLTSMIKKWHDSSNHDSRAQIAKAICISYWKKIQAYIAEAAKTMASIKRLVERETFKSFEEVKRSASDLENVLDLLDAFDDLKPEDKARTDFLQQLSDLTSNLMEHVSELSGFFSRVEKEKSWSKVHEASAKSLNLQGSSKNLNALQTSRQTANPYEDYDAPPLNPRQVSPSKSLPKPSTVEHFDERRTAHDIPEMPDYEKPNPTNWQDSEQFSEAPDYDVPRGSDLSNYHPEGTFNSPDHSRPTISEFLDYDSPKPPTLIISPKHKSLDSVDSELSPSSFADDEMDYDTPSNNSSLIQMRSKDRDIDTVSRSVNKIISFEELDYDIPGSHAEQLNINIQNSTSQSNLDQMSHSERNLLKYYFPFIAEELNNLVNLIDHFQKHLKTSLGKETMQATLFINDVKSLASCSHKVLFIVDSILKRLKSNVDLSSQLNFSCTKICDYLKNITNLVKQVIQPSHPTSLQNNLLAAVPEFRLHVQSMNNKIQCWKQ